jgi:hypothetical protein
MSRAPERRRRAARFGCIFRRRAQRIFLDKKSTTTVL